MPELKSILPMFNCPSLSLKKGIKRFSYDVQMRTREQNRNNKRKELERFDWFIEWIQTCVAFVQRTPGGKNFIPENFLEINRNFALMSYCNTIGQSNNVSKIDVAIVVIAEVYVDSVF